MTPIELLSLEHLDSHQRQIIINRAESLLFRVGICKQPRCTERDTCLPFQRQPQLITAEPFRQLEKRE